MNILIIVADLGLGGAQQVVINLANELALQNHIVWVYDVYPNLRKKGMINKFSNKVNLVTPQYSEFPKNLIEKSIQSITYRLKISKNYLKHKRAKEHKNNLLNVINKNDFDIVNSHVWWADWFVYEELKMLQSVWWITFHGSYSYMLKNSRPEYKFVEKAQTVINSAKGVIYLSENEINNVKSKVQIQNKSVYKIYNGIPNVSNFKSINRINLGLQEDDFVVFCASRAIKEKGWEELIEAIIELNSIKPKIKLILAGDGTLLNYWVGKYNSYDFIHFLGFRDDIQSLISICNITVLISYTEALPTILIESIFQQKPIIATDVGDTKSIVGSNDCSTGILLPQHPSLQEIAESILKMMDNDTYQVYSQNCKVVSERFKIERMAKDYIRLFQTK